MTVTDPTPLAPLGELTFHRLLVAVDGSAEADLALSAAITSAHRNNAAVTLVAIAPEVTPWAGTAVAAPVVQSEIDTGMHKVLKDAIARIPDDVPVTTVFRHGKPGPAIVEVAEEGTYDAILIGARGLGRVGSFMGSVSQYVMNHAPVAVLVAHPPKAALRG